MARKKKLVLNKKRKASGLVDRLASLRPAELTERQLLILRYGLIAVLILIPILLAVTFRSHAADLPVAESWARSTVNQNIRNQLSSQISQQYPNLPAAQRQQLVEEQFAQASAQQGEQIDAQVAQMADYFRSRMKDDDGQTYLIAIDPYQHLRHTEYLVEYGTPTPVLNGEGEYVDPLMLAPMGARFPNEAATVNVQFHTWTMSKVYALVSGFNPGASVLSVFFWLPVIFVVFLIPPAFLIAWRKAGLLAGFAAATLVGTHAGFIGRTAAGFADTDVFVVLFPLLTAWALLEAFESSYGDWRRLGFFTALTGLLFGLFAFTWGNWWFFFDVYLAMLLAYIVYKFHQGVLATFFGGRFWQWLWFFGGGIGAGLVIGAVFSAVRGSGLSLIGVAPPSAAAALLSWIGGLYYLAGRDRTTWKSFSDSFVRKTFLWWGVLFSGLLVSSAVFVSLFRSFFFFTYGLKSIVSTSTGIKAAVNFGTLWPNVLTTVAELNAPSINGIIGSIGGKFLFFVALMGMLFTLVPKRGLELRDWLFLGFGAFVFLFLLSSAGTGLSIVSFLAVMWLPVLIGFLFLIRDPRGIDIKYALFLILWVSASVFTMTKGVRFVLLLIPPFAIAAGIALGSVYRLVCDWLERDFKMPRLAVAPVVFILLSLLLIAPAQSGRTVGLAEAPSMTDAWWSSLTKIKQDSQPDAIINSWWDFGHWFKYVADRAVTFDGASQNTPMAHWIGRVLLTGDEKEALGILRMLDCGSYLGTQELDAALPSNDDYGAVMLIKEIILLPPDAARARLLSAGLSSADADRILDLTHCDPPEDYFITSGDMVGKAGVWGHFGGWDFAKADAYQNFRRLPQATAVPAMAEKYGWSEDAASKVYFDMKALPSQDAVNAWISPWPGYQNAAWRACAPVANGSGSACQVGIALSSQQQAQPVIEQLFVRDPANESSLLIGFYDQAGNRVGENTEVRPNNLFLVDEEGVERVALSGNLLGQSFVADVVDGQVSRVMLVDAAHADSMFHRLFFMDGKGTSAFEKFSDQTTFTGVRIIVWKVDWSKLEEFGLA